SGAAAGGEQRFAEFHGLSVAEHGEMPLEIELRDQRIEAEVDVVLLEPGGVVHEHFVHRVIPLAEEGGEKHGALIGPGDLVAHEHDCPFLVVLSNAFARTDPSRAGADDKVVSTNHLAILITPRPTYQREKCVIERRPGRDFSSR